MIRGIVLSLAVLSAAAGCRKAPESAALPARVVVLGSSVAEVVCDLGAGPLVVGMDQSAQHLQGECPNAASLNYYRQLSSEGVLSVRPDLVLSTDQAGPPAAVEQLKGSGVRLVTIPELHTWEGALQKIRVIAEALDAGSKADALIEAMQADKAISDARIRNALAQGAARPKVLFVMSQIPGSNALMIAGDGTGAQAMMELAGGKNAVSGFERYRELSNEALAEANPDIVLFAQSSQHGFQDSKALENHPSLKKSPAVRSGRIHGVDLGSSLNFGSRLADSIGRWSALFFPAEQANRSFK